MSTQLKASLENAIQEWADKESNAEYWLTDSYWGETMVARMTEAAYAVMMASHEAQIYAETQK